MANPPDGVVVVEIDEKSLAQYGRWPWPRDLLGLVVHRILAGGAATVVLDMMLLEADRGTPDSRAVESYGECRAGTNDEVLACVFSGQPVLAGYAFQFERTTSFSPACGLQPLPLALVGPNQSWEKGFFHASGVLCGVSQISNAAAGNGFLNASPDSDGKLRRLPVVVEFGDRHFPQPGARRLQCVPASTVDAAEFEFARGLAIASWRSSGPPRRSKHHAIAVPRPSTNIPIRLSRRCSEGWSAGGYFPGQDCNRRWIRARPA